MDTPMKRCTKCGKEFPATLEYFYQNNYNQTKLTARCRYCARRAASDQKKTIDPLKEKERLQKWTADHREQEQRRLRQYALDHPDKMRQAAKKWRESHPEEFHRRVKKCRDANPQKERDRNRRNRITNPEPYRNRVRNRRAKRRSLPDTLTFEQWCETLDYWGNCCAYCGNPPGLLPGMELTADHFIPLDSPDCPGTVWANMVPACGSCNKSKQAHPAEKWLRRRYGERRTTAILRRIAAFFEWVSGRRDDDH